MCTSRNRVRTRSRSASDAGHHAAVRPDDAGRAVAAEQPFDQNRFHFSCRWFGDYAGASETSDTLRAMFGNNGTLVVNRDGSAVISGTYDDAGLRKYNSGYTLPNV